MKYGIRKSVHVLVLSDLMNSFKDSASWRNYDARIKALLDLGWKLQGRGAFKAVYSKEGVDVVVKVQSDPVMEVVNYDSAPEFIKPHLLPILAHGQGWSIQERINHSNLSERYWEDGQALCESHGCPGYIPCMADSGPNNHTHAEDGTVIIFDYGQGGQWWSESTPAEQAKIAEFISRNTRRAA